MFLYYYLRKFKYIKISFIKKQDTRKAPIVTCSYFR